MWHPFLVMGDHPTIAGIAVAKNGGIEGTPELSKQTFERFDAAAGIAAYPTPADALLIGSISEFARNGLVR